jgi:uncharacterized protein (TIGR00299 family) protein
MRTLYFDLIGGIAGDMTVAALLDLGVSFDFLKKELARLGVRGFSLGLSTVRRGHGRAKKFDVIISSPRNLSYSRIVDLIKRSRLAKGAKVRALSIYKVLAATEAKVHGHVCADQHFHQVGDLDSFVDIAGTAICLEALGIKDIYYSVVPVNHSLAPATMELLKGKQVIFTGSCFENITPTGMAILAAMGRQVDGSFLSAYEVLRTGTGGGSMDPVEAANILRVTELRSAPGFETDQVLVVEANIDDMNPQFFEPVTEKLFKAGALDVFVTPIVMKKSRPAFLLTVLSNRENFDKITRVVLSDTTAIGARYYPVSRLKLQRKIATLRCRGRRVRVKISRLPGGGNRVMPEYEDCRTLAVRLDVPAADVYRDIKKKAEDKWLSRA